MGKALEGTILYIVIIIIITVEHHYKTLENADARQTSTEC
jgi:hypothetical protein